MKRFVVWLWLLLLLAALAAQAVEERMLMARSELDFPEAMSLLQQTIGEHGYSISRVQHIDMGLTASGYETDLYRIVFFGKPAEVREASQRFPQLIPYLPLMITIFSEGDDTLVVASDPLILRSPDPNDALNAYLQRWRQDLDSMMDRMRGH